MSKRSTGLAVALALLAGLVARSDAQTPSTHLEAAKKEGKVVWYTSLVLPSAERVAKLFETAYPDIKVEVHRTGSQRILQRVMQELSANIKNVDVIHTSDAGHYVLLKEKKLHYTSAIILAQAAADLKDFKTSEALYRACAAQGAKLSSTQKLLESYGGLIDLLYENKKYSESARVCRERRFGAPSKRRCSIWKRWTRPRHFHR